MKENHIINKGSDVTEIEGLLEELDVSLHMVYVGNKDIMTRDMPVMLDTVMSRGMIEAGDNEALQEQYLCVGDVVKAEFHRMELSGLDKNVDPRVKFGIEYNIKNAESRIYVTFLKYPTEVQKLLLHTLHVFETFGNINEAFFVVAMMVRQGMRRLSLRECYTNNMEVDDGK